MVAQSKLITKKDNLKKILVVGDGGVGKTCLVNACFPHDGFDKKRKPTFGIDVNKKNNYVICDLPGYETCGNTCNNLDNINLCIIVYDVTRETSYKNIEKWKKKVIDKCGADKFVIIGNKVDLENKRKINDDNTINISIKNKINLLRLFQEIDVI